MPTRAQIVTRRPDGSDARWAGRSGAVTGVRYSHVLPGGANQLSFTLQADPLERDASLAVGRQVQVYAGPRPVWDGQLDEPSPGDGGWQVTAHGAGTFGAQFDAYWSTGIWDAGRPDQLINDAIGRGLRWVNNGDLSPLPSGAWLGQPPANASMMIDALLSLVCSRGGLTWQVKTRSRGNVLRVFPLPSGQTRLLFATGPVTRALAGVVNAVALRYQSSGTPSYGTTWATSDKLIATYGRTEQFIDLSGAGTDTGGVAAQATGAALLAQYQQAAWGGPFTVHAGEYLTSQGTAVSLACESAGEVVRVIGADYGGQVGMGLPATFTVGQYEYDEDTGTAQITPFGSVRTDWPSLVAASTGFPHHARGDPFGVKGP